MHIRTRRWESVRRKRAFAVMLVVAVVGPGRGTAPRGLIRGHRCSR